MGKYEPFKLANHLSKPDRPKTNHHKYLKKNIYYTRI